MIKLIERFLAAIDHLIGCDEEVFGAEHTRSFYTNWGIKMAIIRCDGCVRFLGNSLEIIHTYDSHGNLLSRRPMRKTLKKGERIVYGSRKAYEAYNQHA